MTRILTVVGARPQFIKAAPVSLALLRAGLEEVLVHSGQHYDNNMSDIFFTELGLSKPDYQLEIGSGSHAYQVGEGLKRLEAILIKENPDFVLVYGDTNTTLAGALAAKQLGFPVAHIEAGVRSFRPFMIEEINRTLTDRLSSLLLVPTDQAVLNLKSEGIESGIYQVGDVMLDASLMFLEKAESIFNTILADRSLEPAGYYLLTMHRAETTGQPERAASVLHCLDELDTPVLFPVHPRIRSLAESLAPFRNIRLTEPLGYLEMLLLEKHARAIITDSGGVQKEAAFFEVPCITLRDETEWIETIHSGWNHLAGLSPENLRTCLESLEKPAESILSLYGDGKASQRIASLLSERLLALC